MTTPITYTNITSAHWQPALGTPGDVVTGLRDIDQAIRIILTTPLGADPHRPEFGSRLFDYLDWPVNRVTPHLVRESVEAIRRWETRVTTEEVLVGIEAEHVTVRVRWRVADGVSQLTEVTYGRSTAA
ncbi:GPW/gp25 family protein [Pseudomonas nicosulfuronedens]|uniref:GPW/gp25 family protein n=1 Tax=Pseudomonas nicosulfuronedens TaxID=2571105 RepID=UPI002448A209|nr:GPW/gp25 family protein [Pseudomonas nicosulfuronedens]MDH1007436.1 GPW/gp25 family protein [Pseudomonas nicosulfuronedens]MDH1977482.1 GPW/gp25 family protein [Pseudomonas nicosulfuronedens]MDH2028992.1 GPW/gp25 family protein [Pseudomonas nicosulfuronedens]